MKQGRALNQAARPFPLVPPVAADDSKETHRRTEGIGKTCQRIFSPG